MRKIVLISCVKKKKNYPCEAKNLYISELFKKSLEYAQKILNADEIFILSAKYGLVPMEKVIAPYDETLNKMNKKERLEWASKVIKDLEQRIDISSDEVVFLAGKKYREFIESHIKYTTTPMAGLGIGQQLHFLKKAIN